MTPEQQKAIAIAKARAAAQGTAPAPGEPDRSYSGGILPFSRDARGNVGFDSNAGILGSIKRAFTLPGEVYQGDVDPMSDEGLGRALEMGATVSPVNPAIRAGERAIPGVANALRRVKVRPPSAEALTAAGSAGYDAARDMGVHYSSAAVARIADDIQRSLEADGILDQLAPKTFSILRGLAEPPPNSTAPLAGIEAARRALGNAGKDFTNPTEQLASRRVVSGLDDFIEAPPAEAVVAGPATAAGDVLATARGNYAAGARSDRLTGVEEAANLRAASANSGLNIDNAIRQRVASLLLDPEKVAGYSDEEVAALRDIAAGTPSRNALRFLGNLLGGGGGLGSVVAGVGGAGAGALTGNTTATLLGAGVPAVGVGIKAAANALTRRALSKADASVRERSPLYSEWQRNAPLSVPSPAARSAIPRVLMTTRLPQPNDHQRSSDRK